MSPSIRWPSQNADPSPLGRPLQFEFSGKTASNRFLKAALTERISSWDPVNIEARGIPSHELINLYKRWGEGGFGIILTGNILIDPEHWKLQETRWCLARRRFRGGGSKLSKPWQRRRKRTGFYVLDSSIIPGGKFRIR